MTQEQIFQIKLTCAQLASGNIDMAQQLYTWITEEAVAAEEAAKEARTVSQQMRGVSMGIAGGAIVG